ncbi:hypothetical protein ZYGR_0AD01810 [Zygosaccharomyces rouxii]|uniref:ZYRO0G10120p n=2 Tax=Zygosaccharomyces rouxii TaxID=4956 RepID=C5E065_ZYGRC|nr:uncharacterized protein ZYRO0G10120g [Zygosaccharomyces rouxii]KAH9202494.1 hypothetical protein LQ764DRAFT_222632 [Zygosaccharomyces rouxii]GAV50998.1 hypothetical protein ZYGR_0AD01810 [Zygosaccharomyces rouxii]CAR29499.1 ZYRO0G10120p [Zygosaccharomyces rouxii]
MFHNQLDLKAQLKQYKLYHREKTNVLIHMVFVPTILFSTCCMAHRIPLGHGITLTNVLTTVFALHYVLLCFVPGLIASLLLAVLNWSLDNGKIRLHAYQEVSLFVMGWIVQFIGHGYFEHCRPAIIDNLIQSLVTAPYFVLFEVLFKLGFYKQLQAELDRDIKEETSR